MSHARAEGKCLSRELRGRKGQKVFYDHGNKPLPRRKPISEFKCLENEARTKQKWAGGNSSRKNKLRNYAKALAGVVARRDFHSNIYIPTALSHVSHQCGEQICLQGRSSSPAPLIKSSCAAFSAPPLASRDAINKINRSERKQTFFRFLLVFLQHRFLLPRLPLEIVNLLRVVNSCRFTITKELIDVFHHENNC